jgi:hypothetical protein
MSEKCWYVLTEVVMKSHQVDILCNYKQYEVTCMLASRGLYFYNLTKLASDEYNLSRIMKDMLDDLELNFSIKEKTNYNYLLSEFRCNHCNDWLFQLEYM